MWSSRFSRIDALLTASEGGHLEHNAGEIMRSRPKRPTVRRQGRPHNWRYVQVPAAAGDACARGKEAADAALVGPLSMGS